MKYEVFGDAAVGGEWRASDSVSPCCFEKSGGIEWFGLLFMDGAGNSSMSAACLGPPLLCVLSSREVRRGDKSG